MFCRNCGKEIGDGNKFCGYCGSVIASRLVVNTPAAEEPTVCGTADNIKVSPTACGVTCLYPPYDTYVQPKPDKKANRIAARVLAIVHILIFSVVVLGAIGYVINYYNYFSEGLLHIIIEDLAYAVEIVLVLTFLIRKKDGYSSLITVLALVEFLLLTFAYVWIFALDTYMFANETLAIKIAGVAVPFITRPALWLFIGSVIKRPVEKMAAVLNLAGVAISGAMELANSSNMEFYLLVIDFTYLIFIHLPLTILLFVYPVLSKPIRKQK